MRGAHIASGFADFDGVLDGDLARLGTTARQRMLERFALSDRNAEVTRLATSLVRANPAILRPTRRAALTSVHGNDAKLRNTAAGKVPSDGA